MKNNYNPSDKRKAFATSLYTREAWNFGSLLEGVGAVRRLREFLKRRVREAAPYEAARACPPPYLNSTVRSTIKLRSNNTAVRQYHSPFGE